MVEIIISKNRDESCSKLEGLRGGDIFETCTGQLYMRGLGIGSQPDFVDCMNVNSGAITRLSSSCEVYKKSAVLNINERKTKESFIIDNKLDINDSEWCTDFKKAPYDKPVLITVRDEPENNICVGVMFKNNSWKILYKIPKNDKFDNEESDNFNIIIAWMHIPKYNV